MAELLCDIFWDGPSREPTRLDVERVHGLLPGSSCRHPEYGFKPRVQKPI